MPSKFHAHPMQKKVKILASLLATWFLFGWFAVGIAQNPNLEDVLYLNNGGVYRGQILEVIPNQTIRIQIVGGSIFVVPMAEITKMTQEPRLAPPVRSGGNNPVLVDPGPDWVLAPVEKKYPAQGLNSHTELLFPVGSAFGIVLSQGIHYWIKPYFNPGIAVGLETFRSYASYLTLRGDIRGEIFRKRTISPYYYTTAGYGLAFIGPNALPGETRKGGLSYGFGFGFMFHSVSGLRFIPTLGFRAATMHRSYTPWWTTTPVQENSRFKRIALGLDVNF